MDPVNHDEKNPDTRTRESISAAANFDRSDRIYTDQELWYFRTREGDNIGPFRYKSEAESNLEKFLRKLADRLP